MIWLDRIALIEYLRNNYPKIYESMKNDIDKKL